MATTPQRATRKTSVQSKSKDERFGDDQVLMDQFCREFTALLRLVKEKQSANLGDTDDPVGDCPTMQGLRVAHYGVLGQKILVIVRKLLLKTDELALAKKRALLLEFGDKFAAIGEYEAAQRYFYGSVIAIWQKAESDVGDSTLILSMYGAAACQIQHVTLLDSFVRHPGTLVNVLSSMKTIQEAMELAIKIERQNQHRGAWLILNGTILVVRASQPVLSLGFGREILPYLKWCILAMETSVSLCTVRYLLWRVRIYSMTCACYERLALKYPKKRMGFMKAAVTCAETAAGKVARLRKEEELEVPLPKEVETTLRQAESTIKLLVVRLKAVAKDERVDKKLIESAAVTPPDRLRIAIDWIDRAMSGGIQTQVTDLIQCAVEQLERVGPDEGGIPYQDFIAIHITLIWHCVSSKLSADAAALVARVRLLTQGHDGNQLDEISHELNVLEALIDLDALSSSGSEGSGHMASSLCAKCVALADVLLTFTVEAAESIIMSRRQLIRFAARRLWQDGAQPLIKEMDASEDPSQRAAIATPTISILHASHAAFLAINEDDILQHGEVCLRLAILLGTTRERRLAIQVLRQYLDQVNTIRDQLSDGDNLMHDHPDFNDQALSCSTMGFVVDPNMARSDVADGSNGCREHVGVKGTGSQWGSIHQELCCVQVDVLLLLVRYEIEESRDIMNEQADVMASSLKSLSAMLDSALRKEFAKNAYALALYNASVITFSRSDESRRSALVEDSIKRLRHAETHERELLSSLAHPVMKSESVVPVAPRIVSRCSTAIKLQIHEFRPTSLAARKRQIAYYMVFAKASGAGTDVSLNNIEYPGTGEPIWPASMMRARVSGLEPNCAYVFAVAAFDENGDVIEGIGETSRPVVALNPLPLISCYGYLAQACKDVGLVEMSQRLANEVYSRVVSWDSAMQSRWALNPFYRHALKRSFVARLPIPLLSMATKCVLIVCDSEPGNPERDGRLKHDESPAVCDELASVESCKKICIGIEIASAAADWESIRVLCFKGYRMMLPNLHLDNATKLLFPALMTIFQGLHCIPHEMWDTDTRSIAARVAFELLRIGLQNRIMFDATLEALGSMRNGHGLMVSNEAVVPSEEVAMLECFAILETLGVVKPSQPASTRPSTSAGSSSAPSKTASTPQATPRQDEKLSIVPFHEVVRSTSHNIKDAFGLLERSMSASLRMVEYVCKLSRIAIERGDDFPVDQVLATAKVSGEIGARARSLLKAVNLDQLILDEAPPPPPPAATSAPATARSTKTPRQEPQASVDVSTTPRDATTKPIPELGGDDEYVCAWLGELTFMQAVVLYRRLVASSSPEHDDATLGPRYQVAFDKLRGKDPTRLPEVASSPNHVDTTDGISNGEDPASSRSHSKEAIEIRSALFEKLASSCRLLTFARCWRSLQTVCQYLWNSIFIAWLPPQFCAAPPTAPPMEGEDVLLNSIVCCTDSLLEMLDAVTSQMKEAKRNGGSDSGTLSSKLDSSIHPEMKRTMASTTVVTSAMGVIDADTTWISSLVLYTLQALMSAERWEKVVQVGTRYHFLSGGKRFSEQALPLLAFAQQQFLRQQEGILSQAQAHLDAFVTAFMESEAKKKKKKSRLVVEEVLTPEEIEFRTKKASLEAELEVLRIERDRRSRDFDDLQRIQDGLMRTMNKAVQALDKCHELIERYQRGEKTQGLRSQIIGAFNQCVVLARQKRQLKLTCQALQELGDFFWDQGDIANATKCWQESLDNAFNTLRVTQAWRQALSVEHLDENEFFRDIETRLQGDGMWLNLQCCTALAKLMLHSSSNKAFEVVEYALMAAAILRRILRCSFPHPTRDFLYGTYVVATPIWSGQELLVDTEKLSSHQFSTALIAVSQALLSSNHAVEAMPVIACYESVMSRYIEDRDHFGNARRLRVEALAAIGRFGEALEMLLSLLSGSRRFSCFEGRYGTPRQTSADFLSSKQVNDAANGSFSSWLGTIDAVKLQSSLGEHYSWRLVQLILVTLLRFVVQVVQHEPIGTSGSLRPAVNKLAAAILTLVSNAGQQEQQFPRDMSVRDRETSLQLQAEIQLQQSLMASSDGSWSTARTFAAKAEAQLLATVSEIDNTHLETISLDHTIPFRLLSERHAIIARCRLHIINCDIARRQWHDALQHADTAALHCRAVDDLRGAQLFELVRAETLVLLGRTDDAIERLVALCEDMRTHHTLRTLPHIQARVMLAALQRARAIENDDKQLLAVVLETLSIAEDSLDQLLRRDGWIGVNSVDPRTDARLNLYHPAIPMFARLKTDLARALMEAPCTESSEMNVKEKRAMRCVMQGLQAIEHTSKPLGALKARLLFLRGAIEKKQLLNQALAPSDSLKGAADADQVLDCSSTLREAILTSIRDGAHDRELIRVALLELVDLFGEKLVPGQEDEHVQAAFHYLTTAHSVLSQQRTLFHSNELQSASVTSPDSLPSFVVEAIHRQSAGGSDTIEKTVPASLTPAPSGGKNAVPSAGDTAQKKPALDGERIVNDFVSVLRERHVPASIPLIEETTAVLHRFLVQNHATYGKVCCLADLPPVPVHDPEIQAGLVCTIWGRDMTPALTKRDPAAPMTPVLYFTLGTTRIEAPTEDDSPSRRRAERFATAPFLSKRLGLREDHVRSIQLEISRLRIQMEDEDSLVIDRSSFDGTFFGILRRIQQLLRAPPTTKRKKGKSEAPEALVRDAFGTIIPITCSLAVVSSLEDVFNTTRSVSACDNALCYFLRDLLDPTSGDSPVATQ